MKISATLQELDAKLSAFETLKHMLKYCNYKIVSCDCTGNIELAYDHKSGRFPVGDTWFHDLKSAIQKFAELTEH